MGGISLPHRRCNGQAIVQSRMNNARTSRYHSDKQVGGLGKEIHRSHCDKEVKREKLDKCHLTTLITYSFIFSFLHILGYDSIQVRGQDTIIWQIGAMRRRATDRKVSVNDFNLESSMLAVESFIHS
jgi:hypothetical protein